MYVFTLVRKRGVICAVTPKMNFTYTRCLLDILNNMECFESVVPAIFLSNAPTFLASCVHVLLTNDVRWPTSFCSSVQLYCKLCVRCKFNVHSLTRHACANVMSKSSIKQCVGPMWLQRDSTTLYIVTAFFNSL